MKGINRFEFIDDNLAKLAQEVELEVKGEFEKIDRICGINQYKVLKAFWDSKVSDAHFYATTGYGYNDLGREVIDRVYARAFGCEDALVRHTLISGTHALTVALFGILRPGDTLLAATGKPYDTLEEVIGLRGSGGGSLKDFGINYKEVDLYGGKPDYERIKAALSEDVKLVLLQRSKGYEWRESFTVNQLGKLISFIKSVKKDTIVLVDNCYGEFVEKHEPTEVGADLIVGSLIKNPGGGIAQTGGYIAGRRDLVQLAAFRLTVPAIGKEAGCTLGQNRNILQGFFLAPHTVAQSLKTAVFCGALFEKLGFEVCPKTGDARTDVIQAIKFGREDCVIKFCQGIQSGSPVDSFVNIEPWDMPGYGDKVIMAAGTFVQGSSIELSADAPIRPPYIAYMQGGLTYEAGKIGVLKAAQNIMDIMRKA